MSQLAPPQDRNELKLRPSDKSLSICTLQYRAPDVCLGNQQYGTDVDMWSFACVAAELFLRAPLALGATVLIFASGYLTRQSFALSIPSLERSVDRSLGRVLH